MDFMIIGIVIFIVTVAIIETALFAYRNLVSTQRAKIKKRLQKYTFVENDMGDILKNREFSTVPFFNRILASLPGAIRFDTLVMHSNTKYSLGFFLLLAAVLGACGVLAGQYFLNNIWLSILIGLGLMVLPYIYLLNLKKNRISKFQSQLHEALDLIARALRAGHSFTSSLKLAADEFADPLGTEFAETIDEINFGVGVPEALKGLAQRMDCSEAKYFVIAVIIQRETGGNLAELIESLAHIIRERFKFEGNVRTLTAEGRLSAIILCAMPFAIGLWLQISNPAFLSPLFTDPIGKIMLVGAGVFLVIGMLVMRQMVKIEV
ncbi:type II secretion system F family protein [Desulfobacula sp.]|uniref:type II secretion system F family protein n=1 Tax=Desulfobacula sp. TaxID=2593537 RepID=UPI00260E06B7|nr:type II secretion system F family protein [Desulfobacula sp.]